MHDIVLRLLRERYVTISISILMESLTHPKASTRLDWHKSSHFIPNRQLYIYINFSMLNHTTHKEFMLAILQKTFHLSYR